MAAACCSTCMPCESHTADWISPSLTNQEMPKHIRLECKIVNYYLLAVCYNGGLWYMGFI